MFRTKLLSSLVVLTVVLSSCKGDVGPTGPSGQNGIDGNANVLLFNFGSQTTTTGSLSYLLNVEQATVDSSLILVYYNPSNEASTAWYQSPGLGSVQAYETRWFIFQTSTGPSQYTLTIRLLLPDGSAAYTASTTFTKVKVILAPASQIIPLIVSGRLDLSNYGAVRSSLGLAE